MAQVVMVILKELVARELVEEELFSGFDLTYLLETLIDELGAEEIDDGG